MAYFGDFTIDEERIDEVLVNFFAEGKSFTGKKVWSCPVMDLPIS